MRCMEWTTLQFQFIFDVKCNIHYVSSLSLNYSGVSTEALSFTSVDRWHSVPNVWNDSNKQPREECIQVPKMKPCEVKCGNPSQHEPTRARELEGGGCDIPWKVKSELQHDKIERKHAKGKKRHWQLNYFLRKLKGFQHSYIESPNISQPIQHTSVLNKEHMVFVV